MILLIVLIVLLIFGFVAGFFIGKALQGRTAILASSGVAGGLGLFLLLICLNSPDRGSAALGCLIIAVMIATSGVIGFFVGKRRRNRRAVPDAGAVRDLAAVRTPRQSPQITGDSDHFLFVSHASEDRAAALEVVNELEHRGVRCWIAPRDIRPGSQFDDAIADAIEASRAMLLIFSEQCNESEYIHREITVAGESHKVIIPFRIENAQPRRGLRVRLSDLHWIDGFVSRERAIDELAETFSQPASEKEAPARQ